MKKLLQLLLMIVVALSAHAQQSVKGKVVDARTGEPLIGASVLLKSNPSTGVTTDLEGDFVISVPSAGETIVVNYVGYVAQELPASDGMTVKMIESSEILDEVVVIGYGTQRKGDVTSSVASVKSDNFVKGAVKDIGQLMQGKVAGLAITNPSGDPLGNTQIRLRGTSTIGGANTAPLVLIDGIPGDFNTVAPEDVESI
ncbi:MAG: carboxypeptidase-like regulatory domain-containing protein [Muribaculaceae bacterium]|nr:carboxypeptidase-like regulatory domain-containing protein [Muribaculaceae bacterium]